MQEKVVRITIQKLLPKIAHLELFLHWDPQYVQIAILDILVLINHKLIKFLAKMDNTKI